MNGLPIDDEVYFSFKSSVIPDWTDPGFFTVNGSDQAWDLTQLHVGEFAMGSARQDKDKIRSFISEGKMRDQYFEWWQGFRSKTD